MLENCRNRAVAASVLVIREVVLPSDAKPPKASCISIGPGETIVVPIGVRHGLTMIMFESEDAANRMSEQVRSAVPGAVTLEKVEVRVVAAHA